MNSFSQSQQSASLVEALSKFAHTYQELLLSTHLRVIYDISISEYNQIRNKEVFVMLLNYIELMYEKTKTNKYVTIIKSVKGLESAYKTNDKIYFLLMNYLKMKRDLFLMYNAYIDPKNEHIITFLKQYPIFYSKLNEQYDNAQLSVDSCRLF